MTDPLATTWQDQVLVALEAEPLSDLQLRDAESWIVRDPAILADPGARLVARLLTLLADAVELGGELPCTNDSWMPLQRAIPALRDAARRAIAIAEEEARRADA